MTTTTTTATALYDVSFLSAYLDGRLAKDNPQRVLLETDLMVNTALSHQLAQLTHTQGHIQTLLVQLDASPDMPTVTQAVMQRVKQTYADLASPPLATLTANGQGNPLDSARATPLTCSEMTPALLCAWADGELLMAQHQPVSQHLAQCPVCQHSMNALRQTSITIQQSIRQQSGLVGGSDASITPNLSYASESPINPTLSTPLLMLQPPVPLLPSVSINDPFKSRYGGRYSPRIAP
jgi:anti-sigma factor RsiW